MSNLTGYREPSSGSKFLSLPCNLLSCLYKTSQGLVIDSSEVANLARNATTQDALNSAVIEVSDGATGQIMFFDPP